MGQCTEHVSFIEDVHIPHLRCGHSQLLERQAGLQVSGEPNSCHALPMGCLTFQLKAGMEAGLESRQLVW